MRPDVAEVYARDGITAKVGDTGVALLRSPCAASLTADTWVESPECKINAPPRQARWWRDVVDGTLLVQNQRPTETSSLVAGRYNHA
jgi:hypothetical protein